MTPTPSANRRLVSETIHERLRADILRGRYAPGDALPSERALSEAFGANRHAVREAVKRLQQAGLVHVAQGGATRVLDWTRTGGLELLGDLGTLASSADVLRSVAEMRASIGADAARLCAGRASGEERARLRELAAAHGAATGFDARLEAYEALWAAIVDGSGNLAYRLAYNALVAARHGRGLDARIYAAEIDDPAAAARLAGVIAQGDGERAQAEARALLRRTVEAGAP